MKKLLNTLMLLAAFVSCYGNAHSEHGSIDNEVAVEVAAKSVQQLVFKDQGFEVGKLDPSWKAIGKNDLSVVKAEEGFFVISAKNDSRNDIIYFQISSGGEVLDVAKTDHF